MARDRIRNAWYSEKDNVVYINSHIIDPDMTGLSRKERWEKICDVHKMSYLDRIEKYCPEAQKKELYDFIAEHGGCSLSEYVDAY